MSWDRTDTWVLTLNTLAFCVFIGNCWWHSLTAVYVGCVVPLALQGVHAVYKRGALYDSLVFGCVVGCMWPFGEWFVAHTLGWWGQYLQPDIAILETPLYAILIAWLASTYCVYAGLRARAAGFGAWAASLVSGVSALGIGAIGENLFVSAAQWHYESATFHLGAVPTFIPVSYALSYALAPLLRKAPVLLGAFALTLIMLVISMGLGLAVGFFPR
jgi:hypothetical protein